MASTDTEQPTISKLRMSRCLLDKMGLDLIELLPAIDPPHQDLAARARDKRLSLDEVHQGTFTVNNFGAFGTLIGTPIIVQPQAAILGFGRVVKRPVVIDDAITIRSMAYLCLSFDHRLLDGAYASAFLNHVQATLERFDFSLVR